MVELGFAAYFTYVDRHRDAFKLFYGGSMARDEEFAEVVNQTETAVAGLVAGLIEIEGLSPGQRQVLGHGIVGHDRGGEHPLARTNSDADPAALAHQLADLAWRGLRGVHPDTRCIRGFEPSFNTVQIPGQLVTTWCSRSGNDRETAPPYFAATRQPTKWGQACSSGHGVRGRSGAGTGDGARRVSVR